MSEQLYNKGLHANWLPNWAKFLLTFLWLAPIMSVTGVFSGNSDDTSGAFASYPEHISMANNALNIAMGLALVIAMRIKTRFRSKEIFVGCSVIIVLLLYYCSITQDVYGFIAANFFIGLFKMLLVVEVFIPAMYIMTPNGHKGGFYSLFYPMVIIISTFTASQISQIVFNDSLQTAYWSYIIMMMVVALTGMIFIHDQRFSYKVPLYQVDWLTFVCLCISFMLLNYGLVFMKQQNWFNTASIKWSFLLAILLFAYVYFRQSYVNRPLVDFSAFSRYESVQHSLILLMLQGAYLASAAVFMTWTKGILGYNAVVITELNLWLIPGLIFGGIFGLTGFRYNWNIKYFILFGFTMYFLHTLYIYLLIQPNMAISDLYFPMVLKGMGTAVFFIGIWYYGTKQLPTESSLGVIGIMLVVRSFLSVATASALIAYLMTQFQQQSLHDMSNYWDMGSLNADSKITYSSAQVNAVLASGKTLLGYFCLLFLPIVFFILSHDYGRPRKRDRKMILSRIIERVGD
ncbi:MFS transporter [Sphingobacterium hungaricum]